MIAVENQLRGAPYGSAGSSAGLGFWAALIPLVQGMMSQSQAAGAAADDIFSRQVAIGAQEQAARDRATTTSTALVVGGVVGFLALGVGALYLLTKEKK